jgi:hypothetical protein
MAEPSQTPSPSPGWGIHIALEDHPHIFSGAIGCITCYKDHR